MGLRSPCWIQRSKQWPSNTVWIELIIQDSNTQNSQFPSLAGMLEQTRLNEPPKPSTLFWRHMQLQRHWMNEICMNYRVEGTNSWHINTNRPSLYELLFTIFLCKWGANSPISFFYIINNWRIMIKSIKAQIMLPLFEIRQTIDSWKENYLGNTTAWTSLAHRLVQTLLQWALMSVSN